MSGPIIEEMAQYIEDGNLFTDTECATFAATLRRLERQRVEAQTALKRMADYMDGNGPDRTFAIARQLRAALAAMEG